MSRRCCEVQDDSLKPGEKRLFFECPGCKCGHCIIVPRWTWNGSFELPTFSPSILTGGPLPPNPDPFAYKRCHSFVKDGKIQFLSDCHHELKNQTVDLPDLDDFFEGK